MKKYFLLVACLIVSAFCFSSCNESSNAIPEEEAIEFLQQVYPNMTDPEMESNGYEIWEDKVFLTDRCREYASIECDYDPVYCTQDGYAWVKPNPAFTKHALIENGYVSRDESLLVSVKRSLARSVDRSGHVNALLQLFPAVPISDSLEFYLKFPSVCNVV